MRDVEFEADLATIDPDTVQRVRMTVGCRDTDSIPKVPGAGEVFEQNGQLVQRMHNGLLIEEGCYYGPWMTVIIKHLQGHHEPQEEVVVDSLIRRLKAEQEQAPDTASDGLVMIEFGSFWSYYSMWFTSALPHSRAIAMEPDPAYLEVGRRNAALNGLGDRITFVHGAVGAHPGTDLDFTAESDGKVHAVPTHDLASLMEATGVSHADVVLADIQGAETILLQRAAGDLAAGRVRFLIVSTHHWSISGDALTHQRVRQMLADAKAHVIVEHTVSESYSGDGLIAVSFDPRDADFSIDVSHARAIESLFGELEPTVNHFKVAAEAASAELTAARTELASAKAALDTVLAERDAARAQLSAVFATKLWRWSSRPRETVARLRGR